MLANAPEINFVTEQAQKPAEPTESAVKTEQRLPARPKKSALASKYQRLFEIHGELQTQNTYIFQKEETLEGLEKELSEAKGIFKIKQRLELQEQIKCTKKELVHEKQSLQNIVKRYGYKNVNAFMTDFNASRTAYEDYQKAVNIWKRKSAGKPKKQEKTSIHERLQQKQQVINEREASKQRAATKSKDRGDR